VPKIERARLYTKSISVNKTITIYYIEKQNKERAKTPLI